MPIFKIANNKLAEIEEKSFSLERDLQKLTEENLDEVFGYEFVCGALNRQLLVQNFELELYDPDVDALGYVSTEKMSTAVRVKLSEHTKL